MNKFYILAFVSVLLGVSPLYFIPQVLRLNPHLVVIDSTGLIE